MKKNWHNDNTYKDFTYNDFIYNINKGDITNKWLHFITVDKKACKLNRWRGSRAVFAYEKMHYK